MIVDAKITDWMAGLMLPHVQSLIATPMLLLVVVLLAMLALRFLDPTAFIAMPLIFLPLQEPLAKAGIPPLVLTAPLLLASAPFWLLYMNFWMALGDSVTQKQGFTRDADVQRREHLRGLGDPGVDRRRVLLAHDRRVSRQSYRRQRSSKRSRPLADIEISVTRSRPLSRISMEPRTPLPDISATIKSRSKRVSRPVNVNRVRRAVSKVTVTVPRRSTVTSQS